MTVADRWEKLEAEMRRIPLEGLSGETQRRILEQVGRRPGAGWSVGRCVAWAAAAAACVTAGVTVWLAGRGAAPPGPVTPPAPAPGIALAAGWRIRATGAAEYHVVKPDHVRLERGELLAESIPPAGGDPPRPVLTIDTPAATAAATGTRFYIGVHTRSSQRKGTPMKPFTRVFVLAGVVALSNSLGSVTGQTNDLLAADTGKAPAKLAIQANSDFAFDLYRQLAKENAGKNMFFSPYSISSALAMTAEGARGQTALEMGKALQFPKAARRVGDDAQLIPWRTALIHTGMAELNDRLTGGKDKAALAAIRAEISELRKAFEAAKARAQQLRKERKWSEYRKAQEAEQQAAAKLNKASSKVDQYELRIANALWGEKTYPFLDAYINTVSKHYKTGGVFPADFKTNHPAERVRINKWIQEQTNNRIKDMIPPTGVDSLTRLVLANAIFFKGEWAVPFKETGTKPRAFTLAGGEKINTPTMSARNLAVARYGAFNADGSLFDTPKQIQRGKPRPQTYPGKDGFAMLEMPYKGDDLSMVLLAPNAADGLATIEKKLTPARSAAWIAKLRKRTTHVLLPKFKLEIEYKMNQTLKAMGMVRAFRAPGLTNAADFTGMCASKDPMKRLYISLVLHKAFVDVNEMGTEAAAATVVIMRAGGVPRTMPFTPTFKADRPFLFLIRERQTGSILFMGRVMTPAGE